MQPKLLRYRIWNSNFELNSLIKLVNIEETMLLTQILTGKFRLVVHVINMFSTKVYKIKPGAPYLRALILIIPCIVCIIFLIYYQKTAYQFSKKQIVRQKSYESESNYMEYSDIENSLKPLKILVMAFPR